MSDTNHPHIETYNDMENEPRYRIVASNGRTTLDGAEGYDSASNVTRAIGDNLSAIVVVAVRSAEGMLVTDEDGSKRRLRIDDDGTVHWSDETP